jgi:hypothetical protein
MGAHEALERWCSMGDAIAVLYGIFIFILLIAYVTGCERV